MALSVFLGNFGIDRFYLGYPTIGFLKLITFGGFVVGNIADIILIATQVRFWRVGKHWAVRAEVRCE